MSGINYIPATQMPNQKRADKPFIEAAKNAQRIKQAAPYLTDTQVLQMLEKGKPKNAETTRGAVAGLKRLNKKI